MFRQLAHIRPATGVRAFSRMPFRVSRSAIAVPTDPIHENQRAECTWTIRYDDTVVSRHHKAWDLAKRVESLKVLTPGLTIVRVRPELDEDDIAARVRVTSSTADILRNVQVASIWPARTLVDFRSSGRESELVGHLVTEIDLPHAHAVRNLAAIGLGDVVVDPDVLYAGGRDDVTWNDVRYSNRRRRRGGCGRRHANSLKLLAGDESRLFVNAPTTDLQLNHLQIGAWGTHSQVSMNVGGLDIQRSLGLAVVGGSDGRISLTTNSLIAARLKVLAMGSGDLSIAVREQMEVDDLKTVAVGRGSIQVQAPDAKRSARTMSQGTFAVGEAALDTTALSTRCAKVYSLGSNDVRLDARDRLRVRSVGSGIVECIDRLPSKLDVRGVPSPTLIETPRETNHGVEPKENLEWIDAIPTVQDAFEHEALLTTRRSTFLSRMFGSRQYNEDKQTRHSQRTARAYRRRTDYAHEA